MDAYKNFAYGTVATPPSPATTGNSLVLQSGQGALFPTPPFNATVAPPGIVPTSAVSEIVRVTGISGNTLTIVRGPQASDPGGITRSIAAGDQVLAAFTSKLITDLTTAFSPIVASLPSGWNAVPSTGVKIATGVFTYACPQTPGIGGGPQGVNLPVPSGWSTVISAQANIWPQSTWSGLYGPVAQGNDPRTPTSLAATIGIYNSAQAQTLNINYILTGY